MNLWAELSARWARVVRWMDRWPKPLLTCAGLVVAGLVGILDYVMGRDLSMSILYLIPVSFCSWHTGRLGGSLVAAASAAIFFLAELLTDQGRGLGFSACWNSLVLLASFLVVSSLLWSLRQSQDRLEERVERRTAALKAEVGERKNAQDRSRQVNAALARSQKELMLTVSDLRKSHADLKVAQWQLIEAAKFESVGRLAAGVAHEVKNPLMTLSLATDYLAQVIPSDKADLATVLTDMRQAIQRANAVIGGLLDYSVPRQLNRRAENLNAIIEQSLGLVKHALAKAQTTVVLELATGLPAVPLDRNKIEQVFVNIFMNAAHAMPHGGTLAIRTYPGPARDALPHPPGAGAWVTAEIDDTGSGIPPEHLDRVFDPFFTTKPPGEGTGLGLSVVGQIVKLHGGIINLANRDGGGVRVTLMLAASPKENL